MAIAVWPSETLRRACEEVLEHIWLLREEEHKPVALEELAEEVEHMDGITVDETLRELKRQGLLAPNGEYVITPAGRGAALQVIRRRRLAQRLLHDVFDVHGRLAEASACDFEHCLCPEVTDQICTLLGHPTTDQHGRPIPSGECCRKHSTRLGPLYARLADLKPGAHARIAYISTAHHGRLDRLSALGILPNTEVTMHQIRPSTVIQVGETTVALDDEIAQDIHVHVDSTP